MNPQQPGHPNQSQPPPEPAKSSWQQPTPHAYHPAPALDGTQQQVPQSQPSHPPHPSDPATDARHADSKARFPELSLSTGEYVLEFVKRHPIGLLSIWLLTGFLIIVLLAILPFYAMNQAAISDTLGFDAPSAALLSIPVMIIIGFIILGGFIATVVYQGNRFYLTNESVVQHVRISLFNNKNQVINLVNVEDVSFEKKGILQQLLDYGTLRLSTQGEETIYRFYFVSKPQKVVDAVHNAVEIAMAKLEGNLRAHQIRE